MPDPLLKLEAVTYRYAAIEGTESAPVLDHVNLTINAGETVAIVGPSGCGKSTLLNLIGALDRPTSGLVQLEGQDLSALDDEGLARLRNRRIGFIFQDHHLLPQCTVLENVLVPTLPNTDISSAQAHARAKQLLDRVGLTDRLHHRPGQLSGGQRQRAAVVRALINQPALLLADEPTGALDHASSETLSQLLLELNREQGVALITVTHAQDLAARMHRCLTLQDGHLHEKTE